MLMHPLIRELQAPPLVGEATLCLEGADLPEFEALSEFVSPVKWGYAAERAVEAGHGIINLRCGNRRNRSEAFDSLFLRLPDLVSELQADVDGDGQYFNDFARILALARTPHPAR